MSIQSILDQQAIDMLPRIKPLIEQAPDFEKNQMTHNTIWACMNSQKPIDQMNESEILCFEMRLINAFKFNEWIK